MSDLPTLLVGERDPGSGDWSFYYQRSSYVLTAVQVTNAYMKDVYVKPTSAYQKLRKAVGKVYDGTLAINPTRTKMQQRVHNRFTPFARLNFP